MTGDRQTNLRDWLRYHQEGGEISSEVLEEIIFWIDKYLMGEITNEELHQQINRIIETLN